MKRVEAACITQMLRFSMKEGIETDAEFVREEAERYKADLVRRGIEHRIISEKTEPDGSILLEIKKQYNSSPVGKYME